MNPRAVLQPASRLSLRRPRSPAPTPLTTEPHVRLTSHERPAATRALTLLRHEPKPHATRPPAPTHIHLRPTGLAPTLPVAPRRVSTVTTLTNFQSGSIRPNPFSLLKPRGEKPKLRVTSGCLCKKAHGSWANTAIDGAGRATVSRPSSPLRSERRIPLRNAPMCRKSFPARLTAKPGPAVTKREARPVPGGSDGREGGTRHVPKGGRAPNTLCPETAGHKLSAPR